MKIFTDEEIICTNAFDTDYVNHDSVSAVGDGSCIQFSFKYELNGKAGKRYPHVFFSTLMHGVELGEVTATLSDKDGKSHRAFVSLNADEKYRFLCAVAYGMLEYFTPSYILRGM